MKYFIHTWRFLLYLFLSLIILILFSLLGFSLSSFLSSLNGDRIIVVLEIIFGVPLMLMFLMPLLEIAKRINFINPFSWKGKLVTIITSLTLGVWFINAIPLSQLNISEKIAFIIYTINIYGWFCIYTSQWDRNKVSKEWFVFSDK